MFAFSPEGPSVSRSRALPAGLADRVRPTTPVAGRLLPVPPALAPLFPDGALRRGTTTTVSGLPGHGSTTLALALLSAASQSGSWCAAVGLTDPGVVAAAELGVDLRRVVLRLPSGQRPRPGTLPGSTSCWCTTDFAFARQQAWVGTGSRAPGRLGRAGRARQCLARGRRPGADSGCGRVGGRRAWPRAFAGAPGRRRGERPPVGRPLSSARSGSRRIGWPRMDAGDGPDGTGPRNGPEAA